MIYLFNKIKKYIADTIIKKDDTIIGFIKGNEVFRISNIKNFEEFKLTDEKGQEIEYDKSNEQILKEQNNALIKNIAKINIENKKKDAIATNLVQTIATLNLRLNKIEKEKEGK